MYRLVLLIAACIQTVLIECDPYAVCFNDALPRFTQCASVASLCCCRNRKGLLRAAQQEVILLFGLCMSVCVCVCVCVCARLSVLMERHQRAHSQTVVYSCTNRAISDIVHE